MGLADIEITEADGCVKLSSGGQVFARCNDIEHAETIKKALERCAQDLTAFACVVYVDDHRDIMEAVERRKALDCEPDESDSCELGGMIAEICRGWMERVDHDTSESERIRAEAAEALTKHDAKPQRTDNGDGTVTVVVPVTVREDVLEGRDVLAVRQPKRGEKYLGTDGIVADAEYDWDSARTGVRVILGPKPQPPAPQFREGCTYRDGHNRLCGPLMPSGNSEHPLLDQCGDMYTTEGVCRLVTPDAEANLLPEEVIVWRHPGLKAGKYLWHGGALNGNGFDFIEAWKLQSLLESWTDPPRDGMWNVVEGQEYATWEGE